MSRPCVRMRGGAASPSFVLFVRFVVALLALGPVAPRALAQGGCTPQTTTILPGQTLTGDLDPEDCVYDAPSGARYDVYTFAATAGTAYTVGLGLLPNAFMNPRVVVKDPSGAVIASDDDGGIGTDARAAFTAAAAGVYRIEATSTGFGIGPYQVSLRAGGCPPTATAIAPGQTVSGRLDDADCFGATYADRLADALELSATAGTSYTIVMTTPALDDEEGLNFDPYLVLRDPSGALVAEDNDGGLGANARVRFTAATTGVYRIEATSATPITGTYRVTVADGACPRPATPIGVGQSVQGALSELDCDSAVVEESFYDPYSIQMTAGRQYRVTMTAITGDELQSVDPYLVLRDPSGAIVVQAGEADGPVDAGFVYTPPAAGLYTIEATSAIAAAGGYQVTVQTVSCPAVPTPIAVGASADGELTASDCYADARPGTYADRFTFAAEPGRQYTVALTGALDFVTTLRDAENRVVLVGDDSFVFSPAVAGTYSVEVSGGQGQTGAYTIAISAQTCPTVATPIAEGQVISGALDAATDCAEGDGQTFYDRYVFDAVAGRMYRFSVVQSSFVAKPRVVGAPGYTPFFGDPPNTTTHTFRAAVSGPTFFELSTWAGPHTGPYRVSYTSFACGSTNAEIAVGSSVNGSIDAGDCYSYNFIQIAPHYEDTYTFQAVAGQAYVVTLVGAGSFEPHFRLTNPTGAVVVDRGENFQSTLTYTYTAPVSGTHTIEVTSQYERNTGAYTLSVAQGTPCQSTSGTIAAGQSVQGALSATDCYNASPNWATAAHYDRYAIRMTGGVRYSISEATDGYRPLLLVRTATGAIASSEVDPGPGGSGFPGGSATIRFTPSETGDYLIDVSSDTQEAVGGYTLSVSSNAGCADAVTPLAIGTPVSAVLDANDCDSDVQSGAYRDLYSFSGAAGTRVRISMDSFTVDPYVALFDPSGALVGGDDDGGPGDDARLVVTLPATGTYRVEATSFQVAWVGDYTIRVDIGGAECAPDVAPISVSQALLGSLSGNECVSVARPGSFVDDYTFAATAGSRYSARVGSYDFDAYVAVLDPSGAVVASNDDGGGGLDARVEFVATTSGTYTIEATTSAPDAFGFYEVALYPGAPVVTECTPAGTPLGVGQTFAGALTADDCESEIQDGAYQDRYAFGVVANRTYAITMTSTAVDPWLVLLIGDDGVLAQGDDTDDDVGSAEIVFTAARDEVFVFEATTAEPGQTGAYTVSVVETENPATRGGTAPPACMTRTLKTAAGRKIENSLTAADCLAPQRPSSYHNRYTLRALAGASYAITMSSDEVDSRLYLVGPGGSVVAEDDNGAGKRDARILLTAPADGTYTIVATTTGVQQTGRYALTIDGRTDETAGVYVPATGVWFLRNANSSGPADLAFAYGAGDAGFVPLRGDWDGDGVATVGLYTPATGTFFLRNANSPGGADVAFTFGAGGAGLVPVVGDWNGDGVDTVGVYAPATGVFFLRNANASGGADAAFQFGGGGAGSAPLAGDWNGDGTDSVGLYNPATGVFFLKNANAPGGADLVYAFGPPNAGWKPISGDWNADGITTVGVYAPATGTFFLRDAHGPGAANRLFGYGPANAAPLAGDWNGR